VGRWLGCDEGSGGVCTYNNTSIKYSHRVWLCCFLGFSCFFCLFFAGILREKLGRFTQRYPDPAKPVEVLSQGMCDMWTTFETRLHEETVSCPFRSRIVAI